MVSHPFDTAPVLEHVTDIRPAEEVTAPSDAESTGLYQEDRRLTDLTADRDNEALAQRPVQPWGDLDTTQGVELPIASLHAPAEQKDPTATRGSEMHTSDAVEASDEPLVEPAGETATARSLGMHAMNREAEVAQPGNTAEVRHGILSLFADKVAARDPAAADQIRVYRDKAAGQRREEQGDGMTDAQERGSGVSKAGGSTRHAPAVDRAVLADRDESSSSTAGHQQSKVTAFACGKMSDIVGVEDPHSAIGGLFHDLALLLPFGEAFKTDYDRACDAYFEQHRNVDI